MRYGLTGTARTQGFRGHTVPYHIARERDLQECANRNQLFVRGLCGVALISFYRRDALTAITLCKRCVEMHGA